MEVRRRRHSYAKRNRKADNHDQTNVSSSSSQLGCAESRSRKPASYNNLFQFCLSELTRGYTLENDEARYAEKKKKVHMFIKIPMELEQFLFYGFLQCSDAFLFTFTFLPLRFVAALWQFLVNVFSPRHWTLSASQICDILKVLILACSCAFICLVDTSVMYHLVRGQAVIKLYIFYNMLEVADKLLSSFGQDILDALYWTATGRKTQRLDRLGFAIYLCLAIVYVILHTLLVLLQAATLNVAFNSHNKALLTIMMSNNFVELKGSVFKKFAKNNLFQMSCSDVRERFHYCILLLVVVMRNMAEFSWKAEHLWEMLPDLFLVLLAECFVDWMKHSFITKFNEIPVEVYKDFTITISYDAARSRQKDAFSDHSDQVSRRMGFIPLPLSVVLVKVVIQTINFDNITAFFLLALAYVALTTLKVLNSIVLLGSACSHIEAYEEAQRHAELLKRLKRKSKSVPVSPCRLSLVEFSDVMQQSQPAFKGMTFSDVLSQAAELAVLEERGRWSSVTPGSVSYLTTQSPPTPIIIPNNNVSCFPLPVRKRSSSCMEKLFVVGAELPATPTQPAASEMIQQGFVPDMNTTLRTPLLSTADPTEEIALAVSTSAHAAAGVVHSPLKLFRSKSIGEFLEKEATEAENEAEEKEVTAKIEREFESLVDVDRYTLCNNDRIES